MGPQQGARPMGMTSQTPQMTPMGAGTVATTGQRPLDARGAALNRDQSIDPAVFGARSLPVMQPQFGRGVRYGALPQGVTAGQTVMGPNGQMGRWSAGGNFHAMMGQQPQTQSGVSPYAWSFPRVR